MRVFFLGHPVVLGPPFKIYFHPFLPHKTLFQKEIVEQTDQFLAARRQQELDNDCEYGERMAGATISRLYPSCRHITIM